MKALVICHKNRTDLGILETVLEQRNFHVETHIAHMDVLKEMDPKEPDLLMYMGGPMGVYQADIFPYIQTEIDFLKRRIDADKPYLGICLGGQILAAALGAKVYPGKQGKEIGWVDIKVNEEGMKTPVRHLDFTKTKMMEWHGDTFDKPEGTTLLASTELYPYQAFSYGKKTMGLQFHPEVTMHVVESWMAHGFKDLENNNQSVPSFRESARRHIEKLNQQTTLFFNEWLDQAL